ncbi:hypothetical protein WDU94_007617, partial [Cyamophila willieti]
ALVPDIHSLEVLEEIHVGDHLPVVCTLDYTVSRMKQSQNTKTMMKWKEENKEAYKAKLTEKLNSRSRENQNMSPKVLISEMSQHLKSCILETAEEMNMKIHIKQDSKQQPRWYNRECKEKKYLVQKYYRAWKRDKMQINFDKYVEKKKELRRLKEHLKKKYEKDLRNKLNNIKNSSELWKILKMFRPKKKQIECPIKKEEWQKYYKEFYTTRDNFQEEIILYDVTREKMDAEFSIEEVERVLKNIKNNKSPGPDKIINEFLKHKNILKNYLATLFSYVLESETLPPDWGESEICCIFKKGERRDVRNYRGIALLNTMTKIFTQLLYNRIASWAEESNVLPEEQGGFRKGRGCSDQIFVLNCLIQIQIRHNKEKLYACFYDFRFCFDSLDHNIIWQKLQLTGLSGKMIRVIRALYSQAKCRVRVAGNEYTEDIKKTKGIMQGDSLSPLIFILVVADLNCYLMDKGFRGIQVDSSTEVILLMYADDLVVLSHSKIDLQKKMKAIEEYCERNKLEVNAEKTKVVVFRKSGKLSAQDKFYHMGAEIEVAKTFTYLGVVFSSSGLYRIHMQQALSKAKIALANVKQIMVSAKIQTWNDRMQLYESVVKVTLLYAGEVWAIRYAEDIEKNQMQFFKSILCLYNNTPSHYIRIETGTVKLCSAVMRMALKWLIKIQNLPNTRLPKTCYLKLKALDVAGITEERYNWVTQVRQLVQRVNGEERFEPENLNENLDRMVREYEAKLHEMDLERLRQSNFNSYYKELRTQERKVEEYLCYKVPIDRARIVCHLRTAGDTVCIYSQGEKHKWKTSEICTICNQGRAETVEHILLECPHYELLRRNLLSQLNIETTLENKEKIIRILNIRTNQQLNLVYFFVKSVLKRRKFLRGE